jgi:hypothetical protein
MSILDHHISNFDFAPQSARQENRPSALKKSAEQPKGVRVRPDSLSGRSPFQKKVGLPESKPTLNRNIRGFSQTAAALTAC